MQDLLLEEGFTYRPASPTTGLLEGPDGSRAGIHWEVSSDGPFIARLEPPGSDHWGVYRLGLDRPVRGEADLAEALRALMPKLRILYQRARVQ
ncbi:MAG: hypothetical protein ACOY93_01280 [Bacillota bacterium]